MKAYTKYIENTTGFTDVLLTVRATQKVAAAMLIEETRRLDDLKICVDSLQKIIRELEKIIGLDVSDVKNPGIKKLLLIITGDKGLCGDLYLRVVNSIGTEDFSETILVGSAGQKYLEEVGIKTSQNFETAEFGQIFEYIYNKFTKEKMNIDVCYASPITLSVSVPKLINLASVLSENMAKNTQDIEIHEGFPILATSPALIKKTLTRNILSLNLFAAILQARVSELSARTVAMENAEDKTQKVLQKLRKQYFKEHRNFATQKQLESFLVHNKR